MSAMTVGLVASQSFAGSAIAESSCAMSYETFETAVAHLDAESCPDKSLSDKAFCRISVGGDKAHVFYFSLQGDRCLIKVESFDDEQMEIKFKNE